MRHYQCTVRKENGTTEVVERCVQQGIYFLMDAGNRHAETVLWWHPRQSPANAQDWYGDEQLPMTAVITRFGQSLCYEIALIVDEDSDL